MANGSRATLNNTPRFAQCSAQSVQRIRWKVLLWFSQFTAT
ncbi:hypothetical protein [Micromonospora coerulea]|nr:hypothetical protein [Micromonospora veneta]